ncbi:AP-1 complex subunit sigma-2 isoform X2 [Puntigrus tetrazona]|nr:AP-1 complex subunit sigma-2 isoform X2 [Puntigrus tetrazona]
MQFMLLFSRQGKLRLQKWYVPLSDKEKKKITRELVQTVLARKPKMCSFLEWRDLKIVYKRYASLYFCCAIEDQDNELITLEIIHRYVELLDKYFGSVCELDIIFNFEKAYFILDEFLLGGEAQETSKKNVLKAIEQADLLQEDAKVSSACSECCECICVIRESLVAAHMLIIFRSRGIILARLISMRFMLPSQNMIFSVIASLFYPIEDF